jgi:hypothetical protein
VCRKTLQLAFLFPPQPLEKDTLPELFSNSRL